MSSVLDKSSPRRRGYDWGVGRSVRGRTAGQRGRSCTVYLIWVVAGVSGASGKQVAKQYRPSRQPVVSGRTKESTPQGTSNCCPSSVVDITDCRFHQVCRSQSWSPNFWTHSCARPQAWPHSLRRPSLLMARGTSLVDWPLSSPSRFSTARRLQS